ncbi:MAG: arabinan endo-1,5-alpha-L-arabinosidase, partial [Bacteroidales bacterium]|nr:arabinan endo-1,5-alpha-L-arabinosidase [Bacteroidales bacterium]
MKKRIAIAVISLAALALGSAVKAQTGSPFIHDPSTVVECDGKYYTFGTGGGGLISEDGWVWNGGGVRPGGGVAPDAIKIGDRYMVVYALTDRGVGNGHRSRVYMMWNKTLDPTSPDFGYTEPVDIAGSDGFEDCDGIDPGLMLGPDGRLWLTYGTYFGYIRIVELDPATGLCMEGSQPVDVAISCEAPEMTYHDGWYYLLATHGTCCDGANSTYNIVVGRSKSPTGPYYDNVGRDMVQGGGKLVLASEKRRMGAGHFGRFIIEEGVE